MMLTLLKGKIHRATCTGADLNYNGSITVDPLLLEAAGILEHEQVDVLNITNGERLTTYAIRSMKRGGGEITINGAAAHRVKKGDLLIICAFVTMKEKEAKKHKPKVVLVNARNQIATIEKKSRPGRVLTPPLAVLKTDRNPLVKKKSGRK